MPTKPSLLVADDEIEIGEIVKAYPRVTFFRVIDKSSAEVDIPHKNIQTIKMAEFKLKINKL